MVARDTGYIMCARVSEYPAHNSSNFNSIAHMSVLRSYRIRISISRRFTVSFFSLVKRTTVTVSSL
jgi:hypothetical protein